MHARADAQEKYDSGSKSAAGASAMHLRGLDSWKTRSLHNQKTDRLGGGGSKWEKRRKVNRLEAKGEVAAGKAGRCVFLKEAS